MLITDAHKREITTIEYRNTGVRRGCLRWTPSLRHISKPADIAQSLVRPLPVVELQATLGTDYHYPVLNISGRPLPRACSNAATQKPASMVLEASTCRLCQSILPRKTRYRKPCAMGM